jgi:hypothetical protein
MFPVMFTNGLRGSRVLEFIKVVGKLVACTRKVLVSSMTERVVTRVVIGEGTISDCVKML